MVASPLSSPRVRGWASRVRHAVTYSMHARRLHILGLSLLHASAAYGLAARLVAVGDLHGDLQSTVRVLRAAGILGEDGHWAGKDATLVQLGDLLDRGTQEAELLSLFRQLKRESVAAGGKVVTLLGNHEVLNALGKATPFVSYQGLTDFGPSREAAFAPGGALATELATYPVSMIIDDTVFVHASLPYDATRESLASLNEETSRWLLGERPHPPQSLLGGRGSPVWCRSLSNPPDWREPAMSDCRALEKALARIGCSRVVVGHTPQASINNACNGAVWRCDTGMSRYVCGGACEALEISGTPSKVRVIKESEEIADSSDGCYVDSQVGESVEESTTSYFGLS